MNKVEKEKTLNYLMEKKMIEEDGGYYMLNTKDFIPVIVDDNGKRLNWKKIIKVVND